MITFVTWKSGVKTEQPHRIVDMPTAQTVFQHLLSQNSKVQMFLNDNMLKEADNPTIPNNDKAKVVSENG